MGNRTLTIILVAVIGALLGVAIISNQSKDSSLQQILQKQNEILDNQQNAEEKSLAELVASQKALEAKIAKLETELKNMKVAPAQPSAPPSEDFDKAYTIPVDHSYLSGNKNATVTLVEFVDFECPFCARFHQPVEEVLSAYPTQVNYMIKNFPLNFHANARPAAKAALAAGEQGKYYEMADKILDNSRSLNQATFERLAGEIGINVDKFKKDLQQKDAAYEDIINKDIALGESIDVRGTPTFYLNGKKTMARDLARFKTEIDALLGK